jgi:hypothetical protein
MREQAIDYLKRQNLGGLALTTDLPFTEGVALYLQRPKTVYVDITQSELDPIIQTLGAVTISNEVLTTSIFFTSDAKQPVPAYNAIVETLRSVKDAVDLAGVTERDATVSTSYEEDLLVTQVDITLTRLAN